MCGKARINDTEPTPRPEYTVKGQGGKEAPTSYECICVGGQLDGARLDIREPRVYVPVVSKDIWSTIFKKPDDKPFPQIGLEEYRVETFSFGLMENETFYLLVLEGINRTEALKQIFSYYVDGKGILRAVTR